MTPEPAHTRSITVRIPTSGITAQTIWTTVAVIAALVPLTRTFSPGWLVPGLLLIVAISAAGLVLRRMNQTVLAAVAELIVLLGGSVLLLPNGIPRWGPIPTDETFEGLPRMFTSLYDQIYLGIAPVPETPELTWMIASAAGTLMVMISHIALTSRLPLIAGVLLFGVAAVPSFVVPEGLDPLTVAALLVAVVGMLHSESATRHVPRDAMALSRVRGDAVVTSAALAIVATVVALVIAPAVPRTTTSALGSEGSSVDTMLELGRDLRRPNPIALLTVFSPSPPPYLRLATLTEFDDEGWHRDEPTPVSAGQLPEVGTEVSEIASISVQGLRGDEVPVPALLNRLTPADDDWIYRPGNGTVATDGSSIDRSSRFYWVGWASRTEDGTIAAGGGSLPADVGSTPGGDATGDPGLSDESVALVQQVTSGVSGSYEQLVALQNWFRGPEFSYSEEAPVADGYDGSDRDAVEAFLEVRSGYCVHFSSAFALMARTLGIPTRVVVGFLPGEPESPGSPYSTVTTDATHAWPEAWIDGLGWVPFEPTSGLGNPATVPGSTGEDSPTDVPTVAPTTAAPTIPPSLLPTPTPTTSTAVAAEVDEVTAAPLWPLLIVLGIVALCAIPFTIRRVRRKQRIAGGALPLWQELLDTARDARITLSPSWSPRQTADQLISRGAPEDDVSAIRQAYEAAEYAGETPATDPVTDAARLTRIRHGLIPRRSARLRAMVLPRSLVPDRPRAVDIDDGETG